MVWDSGVRVGDFGSRFQAYPGATRTEACVTGRVRDAVQNVLPAVPPPGCYVTKFAPKVNCVRQVDFR